jgi:PTS system D-glucosamine-specific IIC component
VLGLIYAPIYYAVFYLYITKKDVPTPGRGDADVKLMSKADYNAQKGSKGANPDREERVNTLVELLGGLDNLTSIDACITRLRLDVKDREAVDDAGLKSKLGAAGIVGKGKNVQVIFGAEADIFKSELKALKK